MFTQTSEPQFKIPKSAVHVELKTVTGEQHSGEIFLDSGHTGSPRQILNFLNSDPLFLPFKTSADQPRLISKNSIVFVETARIFSDPRTGPSTLGQRKTARFVVESVGTFDAEILIEAPSDQARVLDVLNLGQRFLTVLREQKYCFLNLNCILEVTEISK